MTCVLNGSLLTDEISPPLCAYLNNSSARFQKVNVFNDQDSAKIIDFLKSDGKNVFFSSDGSLLLQQNGSTIGVYNNPLVQNASVTNTDSKIKMEKDGQTYFISSNGLWALFVDTSKKTVTLLYNVVHRLDVNKQWSGDKQDRINNMFLDYCKTINNADPTCYCIPSTNANELCMIGLFNDEKARLEQKNKNQGVGIYTKMETVCPCLNASCEENYRHLNDDSFIKSILSNTEFGLDNCSDKTLSFNICNQVIAAKNINGNMNLGQKCDTTITNHDIAPKNNDPDTKDQDPKKQDPNDPDPKKQDPNDPDPKKQDPNNPDPDPNSDDNGSGKFSKILKMHGFKIGLIIAIALLLCCLLLSSSSILAYTMRSTSDQTQEGNDDQNEEENNDAE